MLRFVLTKLFRAFATALISLAIPGLAFAADPLISPDIARIQERGRLVVAAYKIDMPPFFYVNDQGVPGGIDVELATDIAKRLGVKLEYARIADSFDDLPALIAQRKADVAISYLSRTQRRAAVIRFTQPYVRLRQTVMINRTKVAPFFRNGEHIEALNDPSLRIGAEDGSSYVDFAADRFPKAQIQRYPHNENAVDDLLAGKIHMMVVDEGFSFSLSRDLPGIPHYRVRGDWALYIKVIPLDGARDPIAMAVNREDQTWLAWLDTYIADRQEDGSLDRLIDRYLGANRK